MQIIGERIIVKAVEERDAESLLSLEASNRDFFQQFTELREETFFTVQGQLDRIKEAVDLSKNDKGYLFVILLKGTGQIIGEVMLTEVVRYNLQSCWIGYFLDKEHNGKGCMTEAVKLVVEFAFRELKLHRIEAGVQPHNIGSIKVLLKAGFHQEGIAKKNVKVNGQWKDHQTLAILNEEDEDEGDQGAQAIQAIPADQKVSRHHPNSIAPPIGPYTHLTKIAPGAELLVFSGQVGTDLNGHIPEDLNGQIRNTLGNITRVLHEESLTADNIVKINIWAVETMDWDYFHRVWEEFHGGTPPAMTMAYVPALAVPSLKVEIEVWAAK